MRQDTVILILSALCCLEDHGAQRKPWNLPKVVAKLFLWQPLQDTPPQGHEAQLDMHDETLHQCWQCGGEGWVLGGSLGR